MHFGSNLNGQVREVVEDMRGHMLKKGLQVGVHLQI